jgi:hypothetical protein
VRIWVVSILIRTFPGIYNFSVNRFFVNSNIFFIEQKRDDFSNFEQVRGDKNG